MKTPGRFPFSPARHAPEWDVTFPEASQMSTFFAEVADGSVRRLGEEVPRDLDDVPVPRSELLDDPRLDAGDALRLVEGADADDEMRRPSSPSSMTRCPIGRGKNPLSMSREKPPAPGSQLSAPARFS
jgi:hypothetical protein